MPIDREALPTHLIHADEMHLQKRSSGIMILDKPEGMTSFALVAKARKWLGVKKIGHCGTLDPFATGVMVLCINQATRIADLLSLQDKVYRFSIRFGIETDTLDKTGETCRTYTGPPIAEERLREAMERFIGDYRQQVPRFAAAKVQGRRLYELARKGIDVELPHKDVSIYDLALIDYEWPDAVMTVHCSKGTYVRQLAADMARLLDCCAYVSELRRLASGPFELSQAISLDELKTGARNGLWTQKLISMNKALEHLPALPIGDARTLRKVFNGHLDSEWEARNRERLTTHRAPVRLMVGADHLVALWWPYCSNQHDGKQRCLKVFK